MRSSVLTLLGLTLAPMFPGPGWADDIGSVCGPGATGFMEVGATRVCLRPEGWGAAPVASDRLPVAFQGRSRADAVLRADTAGALLLLLGARGCPRVQTIAMRILDDRPQNVIQGRRWWKEGWSAKGCGRTFPYTVLFRADGKGGTVFTLSPLS